MALVELGVHPTAVLLFGESAAELARSRGHPETARALEDAHAERANLNRISELEGSRWRPSSAHAERWGHRQRWTPSFGTVLYRGRGGSV